MDSETFDAILDVERRNSGGARRQSMSWLLGAALVGAGVVVGALAAIGYRAWEDRKEEEEGGNRH